MCRFFEEMPHQLTVEALIRLEEMLVRVLYLVKDKKKFFLEKQQILVSVCEVRRKTCFFSGVRAPVPASKVGGRVVFTTSWAEASSLTSTIGQAGLKNLNYRSCNYGDQSW